MPRKKYWHKANNLNVANHAIANNGGKCDTCQVLCHCYLQHGCTKEPHTKEPNTKEPNTKEPNTKEPNTKEPNTKEPNTKEPNTKEPNTKELNTKEPNTKEPNTNEPNTKEPNTKEPNTKEPDTKEPDTKEPDTKEPYAKEPYAKEPYAKEPYEPNTKEPNTKEPNTKEPNAKKPNTKEPITKEPITKEPCAKEPYAKEPYEPNTNEPNTIEPNTKEQNTKEQNTKEQNTKEPYAKELMKEPMKEPHAKEPYKQNTKEPNAIEPNTKNRKTDRSYVAKEANVTNECQTRNEPCKVKAGETSTKVLNDKERSAKELYVAKEVYEIKNESVTHEYSPLSEQYELNTKEAYIIRESVFDAQQSNATTETSHIYTNNVPPVIQVAVQGSYHQGHLRFGENSGKQCVANSLLSVIYSKVKDVEKWNAVDLDKILDTGNELYGYLQADSCMHEDYLLVSELPKTLDIFDTSFTMNFHESLTGMFGMLIDNNEDAILMSLNTALDVSLSNFDACFITFAGQTFSVIKSNGYFCIFDSHSRNKNGLQEADGKSILLRLNNLREVYQHCCNLAISMNASEYTQFELTSVHVYAEDDLKNDPLNGVELVYHEERSETYTFVPLSMEAKDRICSHLQLANCSVHTVSEMCHAIGEPSKTKSIAADGNCFFRALSFAISGLENNHIKIREAIVEHMKRKEIYFTPFLRPEYTSISDYIYSSRMNYVGTWATEVELLTAADLLQTDIYTFLDRWLKYSHQDNGSNRNQSSMAIYLQNIEHSHYEVVLSVKQHHANDASITRPNTNDVNMHCETCIGNVKKRKQKDTVLSSNEETSDALGNRKKHTFHCRAPLYGTDNSEQYHKTQAQKRRLEVQVVDIMRSIKIPALGDDANKIRKHISKIPTSTLNDNEIQTVKRAAEGVLSMEDKKRIKRERMRNRYHTDLEYRENQKQAAKKQYRKKRDMIQANKIYKYHTNTNYKDNTKVASIKKYETHREKIKASIKVKYDTDTVHREKKKCASIHKYSTNTVHKEKTKVYSVHKYNSNSVHKNKVKVASVRKYKSDSVHKNKVKAASVRKYNSDSVHKNKVKADSIIKYKCSSEHQQDLKERNWNRRARQKEQKQDMVHVTANFKQIISVGPAYACCTCHRLMFKHQVVHCIENNYHTRGGVISQIAKKCLSRKYLHSCTSVCSDPCCHPESAKSLWICYTCHRKILSGKIPAEAAVNNLELTPIPEELACLNKLENHLIALHIPFVKMMTLPKGGQYGVHGPMVCVPSNIHKITDTLPRLQADDQTIRVKLKRKLSYKGHYQYQFVNKHHLQDALNYLKENNKWYADIVFNNDWDNTLSEEKMRTTNPTTSADRNDTLPNSAKEESTQVYVNDDSDMALNPENIVDDANEEDEEKLKGMLLDTCLQPVDIGQEVLDQHFDSIVCIAPAQENSPVSILMDEGNEAKSFPGLFPAGSPTFTDNREERITLGRYLHCRLMNADNRFASNTDYIFYAQYLSEVNQVVSNVSIALRKGRGSGKKLTNKMLTEKDALQDLFKSDEGYKFLRPIRGTPPFWQSSQKDLFAMIRQLGIPTWFCSFSSADMRWSELIEAILKQHGDNRESNELDWSEKCEILRSNPVTAARMFDNRFRNFLKNVIMSPAQPIGKIKDYFYRVEFQQRGSPHTHCIIWVEDAPKYDKDDDETVATFVDRYISCRLPDKDEDEELHEIVSSVQKHSPRHSKSCKKRGTTCRFNFPKPPSKATFVCRISGKNGSEQTSRDSDDNNEGESGSLTREDAKLHLMALWEALADTSKAYESVDDLFSACNLSQALFKEACQKIAQRSNVVLQRRPQDIWINQYNEDLIRCWNANMDIQYVFDAYSCVVYIVSYISKSESEMGLLLDHAQREARQDGNIGAKAAMRQLGSVYLHNREISAQEAVYRVCNLRLKEGSRKVQFIPIGDEPIKCSLPLCVLQQKGTDLDDDDEIWMTNLVERYKARPKEGDFLNMCLATFASEYRVLAKSQVANLSDKSVVYELENGLGFVQKRTRTNPAVVRYPRFSITNSPEKYYQGILQLFLPYHLDTHLKPPGFERYEDFYQMAAVCMCNKTELVKDIVNANRSMFEIEAECIDQAQETLQIYGPLEDAWAQICPETELERLDCLQTKVSITGESDKNDDIPDLKDLPTQKQQYQTELNISIIPQSVAKPLLRSLNKDQSDMFYYIREWCLNKVHGKKPEPFHIFVTGGAGVGKSHLIKSIYYESTRVLAPTLPNPDDVSVLMVAPTGVAAFNIGATTIHSAFKIGIEAKLPYKPLGEDKINSLRAKLGSLELLIIDEISMVDHKLLCYIHGRLRQIKQSQDYSPFGKISVLAVGDFYQLPPVKGRQLCINSEGVNLWQDLFCIYELKVIMRQKDDLKFAQTLNRLRTRKKADALNPDDELSLRSCETGEESDAIHMFSTNAEVDEHNLKSLFARCSDPICIEAQDFSRDPRTRKMQKRNMPHARVFNTNLSKTVSLGEGARVMLTKNIDVSDGLVNGVFGTITKIVLSSSDTLPTVIYVLFDDKRVGQKLRKEIHMPQSLPEDSIPIEPQEDTINNSGGIRRQFPLKLAWACTVHKVQGLTVDNGVVSLDRIFAPGQAYVALSRVSTIDGLIVQDFKEQAIYCNEKVEQALLCMPKFMKPSESKGCAGSTIMLHNIQGLIPHFEDLKHDTRFAEAHFICLTETWLKDNVETSKVELPNFTFHSNTRQRCYDESNSTFSDLRRQAHGGVGFYHDTNIMCEILALNATNIEYIAFSLPDKVLTIVVVYRPESYRTDVFITNLQILLDELLTITDVCIVMGDFNQNVLQRGLSIQQCMETNGYTQYVKNVTTEGGTLIDHVYVHGLNNIKSINVNVVPTYFSYHEAIRIEIT